MRCSVCHQDYKQSDIIDNHFVKDTTEATNTSDEKAAQVCQNGLPFGHDVSKLLFCNPLPCFLCIDFQAKWLGRHGLCSGITGTVCQ